MHTLTWLLLITIPTAPPLLTPEAAAKVEILDLDTAVFDEPRYALGPGDTAIPALPLRPVATVVGDDRFHSAKSVCAVAASPDGRFIVYGVNDTRDRSLQVFDRATGTRSRLFGVEYALTDRLVFSPDARRLYTGSRGVYSISYATGSGLHVWDFAKRRLVARIHSRAWAITPDGKTLVTLETVWDTGSKNDLGRGRPVVRVRETATWKSLGDYAVNDFAPNCVALTPDGKVIALGGDGGRVRLWDRTADKEPAAPPRVGDGVSALEFSPDGVHLAAAGLRGRGKDASALLLWDRTIDRVVRDLDCPAEGTFTVAFSPDGKHLLTSHPGATVAVWDVSTGKRVARREKASNNPSFLPTKGGLRVALPKIVTGRPPEVTFPDLRDTSHEVTTSTALPKLPFATAEPFPAKEDRDLTLAGGRTLESVGYNRVPQVNAAVGLYREGKLVHLFEKDRPATFDVDPAGKIAAILSRRIDGQGGHTLRIYDLATFKEIRTLKYEPRSVTSFRFSPDGKRLAILHDDGRLRLWDVATLEPLLALDARYVEYGAVPVFSKDGTKVVLGKEGSPVATVFDATVPEAKKR